MGRQLYVLTGINIAVFILVVGFSGLGHAVASGVQQVFITNTVSHRIPIDTQSSAWQQELTISGTSGHNYGTGILTVPSSGCLTIETMSGAELAHASGNDWNEILLYTKAGGTTVSFIFIPTANFLQTRQVTLHADPSSKISVGIYYPSNVTSVDQSELTFAGSIHPCS